jgi:hypothetical protein
MELVPGCDTVDPGAANGTMEYKHGTGGLGSAGIYGDYLKERDGELGMVASSQNDRAVLPDKEERAICTVTTLCGCRSRDLTPALQGCPIYPSSRIYMPISHSPYSTFPPLRGHRRTFTSFLLPKARLFQMVSARSILICSCSTIYR